MNAKISVFVIYVEAIIYFLLYNLHDCTFNKKKTFYIFAIVIKWQLVLLVRALTSFHLFF